MDNTAQSLDHTGVTLHTQRAADYCIQKSTSWPRFHVVLFFNATWEHYQVHKMVWVPVWPEYSPDLLLTEDVWSILEMKKVSMMTLYCCTCGVVFAGKMGQNTTWKTLLLGINDAIRPLLLWEGMAVLKLCQTACFECVVGWNVKLDVYLQIRRSWWEKTRHISA